MNPNNAAPAKTPRAKRGPRVIEWSDVTPETRAKVAVWLADRLGEMGGDAASIAEEEGRDFMPALRGLAAFVKDGAS